MPSTTRRRLLASIAAGTAVGSAGCAGQLPGTSPRRVDAAETGEGDELVWQYPESEIAEHSEGIGYAAIEYEGEQDRSGTRSALEFGLNTTVGGIAASEAYSDYEADWARFRLGPPAEYAANHQYRMWVQPPPWPDVRAGYDRRAGREAFVVELPAIDTGGTITLPVLFGPVADTLPDRLHCSFSVQASDPGVLGESVRASGRGTIDLGDTRSS